MAEAVEVTNDDLNHSPDVVKQTDCPSFKGYEKMSEGSNKYAGNLSAIKKWVILEKIHGSNFSLTVWHDQVKDVVKVKLGRRNDYLNADEKFYKVETQLDFQAHLKKCAINAWNTVMKIDDIGHVEAITIFGELFGGFYPHDSVEKVPGLSPIQKEVVYCPDLKFCGFDIALYRNGHEREYMDYDVVMAVLSEAGFMYSQPLAVVDSFEEAVHYKIGFVTVLPAQFGLPPIPDNLAEGIVIKPMKNVVNDRKQRAIFKKKIDKFSERKPKGPPSTKKNKGKANDNKHMPQNLELLKYEMYALSTSQRLVNTVSKIGPPLEREDDKWKEILQMLENEIEETLQEENQELWQKCSTAEKEVLMKEMRVECGKLMNEYWRDQIKD